ncbi:hypothetical protein [Rhodopila globiformis]|nr:hypothetical protein [Rhodopila globiformis]
MDTIEPKYPETTGAKASPAPTVEKTDRAPRMDQVASFEPQSVALRWLRNDIPYIAMLLLALAGVVFRLPVIYWVILIPVFGIVSVVAGWRNFVTTKERTGLVRRVALDWCALLLAIYLLYDSGVQGVMNRNATSLEMMTLLALGTFIAGVQASVWQICAVGGVLFLAVPALGWLDQSPLLLTAATCVIIALGGVAWWVIQGRPQVGGQIPSPTSSL